VKKTNARRGLAIIGWSRPPPGKPNVKKKGKETKNKQSHVIRPTGAQIVVKTAE